MSTSAPDRVGAASLGRAASMLLVARRRVVAVLAVVDVASASAEDLPGERPADGLAYALVDRRLASA